MAFAYRFVLKDWEQEMLAYRALAEGVTFQKALVNTLVEAAETKTEAALNLAHGWSLFKVSTLTN